MGSETEWLKPFKARVHRRPNSSQSTLCHAILGSILPIPISNPDALPIIILHCASLPQLIPDEMKEQRHGTSPTVLLRDGHGKCQNVTRWLKAKPFNFDVVWPWLKAMSQIYHDLMLSRFKFAAFKLCIKLSIVPGRPIDE
ncbi:Uncharacterized protein HZ326_16353 [Fusarium oxysporum f. sp. albedinis]|nr:Uncharacterized protein HZ326_16353 [Fusarium oxysporum f. sp. albedinis]